MPCSPRRSAFAFPSNKRNMNGFLEIVFVDTFRKYLDEIISQSPELFPATIQHGYQLHDILPPSKKMPDLRLRRIKVTSAENGEEVFSVVPSFVMPYMMGYSDEVEKALREASDDLGSPFGA